jgi:hypothetical protein
LVDATGTGKYLFGMKPVIYFVELENRVIPANYRNPMIRAKAVIIKIAGFLMNG